jgi:NADH:ubiquinone oxidoreductase subunit 4 (subunit M)
MMLLFSLFLEITPETTNYMIMGYAVFSVVMIIYLASLVVRQRNLQRDIEVLEEVEKK